MAALFAAGFVTFLLKKLVDAIGLRPVDRSLGAAFGLLRGVIILLAAAVVIIMNDKIIGIVIGNINDCASCGSSFITLPTAANNEE